MINDIRNMDRNIAKRIKQRRLELEFSYQDLANKTGISKSTLQRYETGYIQSIPLGKLEILASALKTTPAQLMGWGNARITEDVDGVITVDTIYLRDEKKLLRQFKKLNDLGRTRAIERVGELTEIERYIKETGKITENDLPDYFINGRPR